MALILDSGFTIVNIGYVHYEEMAIEIKYGHSYFLEINNEIRPGVFEVILQNQKVFGYVETDLYFPLDDFLFAVEQSKKILTSFASLDISEIDAPTTNGSCLEVFYFKEVNHGNMFVEVYYRGEPIIRLNLDDKKKGCINTQILTKYVRKEDLSWPVFPLYDFVEALEKAKALLLSLDN